MPLSSSPEVSERQSLEATSSLEPMHDTSDPALQVSWQTDQEHNSDSETDFEMEGIKEALVIEPTHPSNSGAYYCATADDVAQLIVKNEGDLFCNLSCILPMTNSLCSSRSVFLLFSS